MKFSRYIVPGILAVLLAALGFVALHGATVQAQDSTFLEPIVFSSNRTGNYEIYVLDPETGLATQLTNTPTNDIEPQWSPDSTLIVFASDRDGDYELFVMKADGTEAKQLTNNTSEDRQPRFLPNGLGILYVSNVNAGQWDLYGISADGAIVRQLTNDPADERGPGAPLDGAGQVTPPVVGQPTVVFPTLTPVATTSLPDAVVDSNTLNVRANPGQGAQILATLRTGDPLEVLAQYFSSAYNETWLQVRTTSGVTGWIYEPLVQLNIPLTSVPSVTANYQAPPPTATPTPAATAIPAVIIEFWADTTTINAGQCTVLRWRVEGIKEVYYQGVGVVGQGEKQECPAATTTYNLKVVRMDNVVDNRYITIVVQ